MKDAIIILLVLISFGCKESASTITASDSASPMDRLKDDKAGELAKKAIAAAGGWDAWNAKSNFSFYKNITHADSTGKVIKNVRQLHQYNFKPHFQARMTWSVGNDEFIIINNGEEAKKYKNGRELIDAQSKNEAWNSSYGSHYVVAMPYKLTDPGVTLIYEGIDSTLVGRPLESLRVEYAKGAGSTGGMHKWWYYFDIETGDLAANYLDYGEGHSVTTYETFEIVDGMRIHNKRYSYPSNENRDKIWLKTTYKNEEMAFDQDLNKGIFKLK